MDVESIVITKNGEKGYVADLRFTNAKYNRCIAHQSKLTLYYGIEALVDRVRGRR